MSHHWRDKFPGHTTCRFSANANCLRNASSTIRMGVKESWSKRQLEWQIRAALLERTVLSPPKVAPVVREIHPEALSVFRDSYTLEFLGLPHPARPLAQSLSQI